MTRTAKDQTDQGPKLGNITSYLLNRIVHRYNQSVKADIKGAGLTTVATRIIVSLKVYGQMTVNELCVHAIAEQPAMSRALDKLEAEGRITRRVSEEDSRSRVVELTESGAALYEQVWPVLTGANEKMLKGISPEDREALQRILMTVLKNIRKNPI